jgi:hypothetical protein
MEEASNMPKRKAQAQRHGGDGRRRMATATLSLTHTRCGQCGRNNVLGNRVKGPWLVAVEVLHTALRAAQVQVHRLKCL